MKRMFLLVLLIICLSIVVMANERNLFVERDENLLGSGYFEDGVLTNGRVETDSTYISVPGLTKNYTFKGLIRIVEMGSQPWNGVRIIIGANSSMETSKLVLTKEWDVRVEFKNNNLNDLIGYFGAINEGMEIDFEVIREGQHYILKLNDNVCLEEDLPEELDAFEEGYEFNLGFESSDCHYEVTNIEIYCPDVPEETPFSTNTPEATTEATKTVEATSTPTPSETDEPKEEKGISKVVVGLCVVAIVLVVLVVIVTVKDRKRKQ